MISVKTNAESQAGRKCANSSHHEEIRAELIQAERGVEKYGYSEKTPEERLEDFKEKARRNGQL